MTSEVCIMNKMGVVLAADSAVTAIHEGPWGERGEKYLKGANKLFLLSGAHRANIGIMIYNAAEISGVPWELLIKSFRDQHSTETFETVNQCAETFFEFVRTHEVYFPKGDLFKNSVVDFARFILSFLEYCDHDLERDITAINAELARLKNKCLDEQSLSLTATYRDQITEASKNVNDLLESNDHPSLQLIHQELGENDIDALFAEFMTRKPNNFTGIVFTGYGQTDEFPVAVDYKCYGFKFDEFHIGKASENSTSSQVPAHLKGFAQSSMLELISSGFDQTAVGDVISGLQETLGPELGAILEAHGVAMGGIQPSHVRAFFENVGKAVVDKMSQGAFEKHYSPLLHVVGMMSISEMAELAESLVELESLKEKISKASESVGGPTDVAVITKNEGLVWTKRKHYFNAELNPRYIKSLC